jgi:hypothetical protein
MSRALLASGSGLTASRPWALLAVLTVILGGVAAPVQAGPLTLRFAGTVDLTEFGASASSEFSGTISWDPVLGNDAWVPDDPGCPDFCLDGSFGAVSATFAINAIDYTDAIDPASRFVIHGWGLIFLDLFFTPPLDLDGGAAPDVKTFSLNLWSSPHYPLVDGELPYDLTFLHHLNKRTAFFSDIIVVGTTKCLDPFFTGTCADADTLTVVAEPASTALLLVGLSAAAVSVRRRRSHAARSAPGAIER